jgi:hypothetical protein
MIKFLEKIYEFTNDGKTYGAYVIEYDGIKHVVIQHENKFYAVAHFVNAPIDKCMMLATNKVINAIKEGCENK